MKDSRPNILFIISDQMRTEAVGARGNSLIKTPTLDRLAAEGTSFRRTDTPSPVCYPARAAFSSGVAPHIAQKVENLPGLRDEWAGLRRAAVRRGLRELPHRGRGPLWTPSDHRRLPTQAVEF